MIQRAINNILGLSAGISTLSKMTQSTTMEGKYGQGGTVEGNIASQVGDINLEESAAIQEDLSNMRAQAQTTDLREKKAKALGIFPTAESRAIREEGLARKESNIEFIKNKIALMRGQETINARAAQDMTMRKPKGGQ